MGGGGGVENGPPPQPGPLGPSPWIRHCTQDWNRIWLSSELRESKNVFFHFNAK